MTETKPKAIHTNFQDLFNSVRGLSRTIHKHDRDAVIPEDVFFALGDVSNTLANFEGFLRNQLKEAQKERADAMRKTIHEAGKTQKLWSDNHVKMANRYGRIQVLRLLLGEGEDKETK